MGNALGFVGCGTIAAAMVEGLIASGWSTPIVVSPRNAEVAASLAARFPQVTVAADNRAVVDASRTVVIAVRPQVVDAVLAELRFTPEQRVVSLVAGVTLAQLAERTAPAGSILRAVPLPAVARRQGATALFPPDAEAIALFDRLGTAIPLAEEREFTTFTAATAIMASYFAAAATVAGWMSARGTEPARAEAYVTALLRGLAGTPLEQGSDLLALAEEHQTRGGLNEQLRQFIEAGGGWDGLRQGLDGIAARLEGAAR